MTSDLRLKRRDRLRLSHRYKFLVLFLSLTVVACTQNSQEQNSKINVSPASNSSTESRALNIWWDKGFTVEEDEALQRAASRWEQQSGNKVKLSFYPTDELLQKAQRAIRAGKPPDILMSHRAAEELNPRLAWEGKLADVSEAIAPVKQLYPNSALQAVNFYNNIAKKRSYYAVPIYQATIHIFYWRNLLEQVGRRERDIPKDWDGFWDFWSQAQRDLRTKQKQQIYGLGFPFSMGAVETYFFFEQILEAYDVQILNSQGQLRVNDPEVRQGIVKCLEWYAKFYRQGYVPPDATNWSNPDNNRSLLNRIALTTPNLTLSIAAAVRQNPNVYRYQLGTIEFPNKPSGKPMRLLVTLRQAVVFNQSQHQKLAKDFLAYLIQPEVAGEYFKAAGGRFLPVNRQVWQDPFWTDPTDPHISTAMKQLIQGQTRPFYHVQNPAYSLVVEENLWGKALNRIVVDRISPEQAADEAIARMKQIFAQWQ
ncbi:carbohydrate ABC transporter substrate-binding protein [Chroococcidiopsis sp. FACHB-1243]|nr:carbohydrate ABC transporter substrate-binding protein [Chroococcidiopsis sp. [FACHB-1243]]